ncbi:hypothetical protein Hdeb2414_s0002g00066501 [Helianthus debilis subsp. tardiflorus]
MYFRELGIWRGMLCSSCGVRGVMSSTFRGCDFYLDESQVLNGTITQSFGAGESDCSVIMLWTYGLASISLTLWSSFFMWLVA